MKKIGTLLIALVLGMSLVGCGGSNNGTQTQSNVSGKVTLEGSTSMEKFTKAVSEAITEVYPNLQLEAQYTGSTAGIEAVTSGKTMIGNSSRALKDEEKEKGIVENIVAIDGIAMIVDTNNKVENLTKQQLVDIYTGKITNWKEVGGSDQPITVVGREAASGTRGAFEEILDIKDQCKYANELNETGAVVAKVSSTPGAIGYVSLDMITDQVKALKIDNVEAKEETIKDGSYTLQRPFVMATKGEIKDQPETVKAVFDFINSDKGQAVIEKVGLVTPQK